MRRVLMAVIFLGAGTPAMSQGFNPFGDNHTMTGAYGTKKSRPISASATAPKTKQQRAAAAAVLQDNDDEDASTTPQRSLTQAPAQQYSSDGGPQPSISGTTPGLVAFISSYGAGNVVIDSGGRSLYYVVSATQAYKYPVAVGREGFAWTGVERVSRKAQWPDWRPPAEMRQRTPGLPEVMTGGLRNPLGARAIYLGSSLYRIHGTNNANSVGSASSSGCFRMANSHVVDLYNRVSTGATVHVVGRLPASISRSLAENEEPTTAPKKRKS